MEVLRRFDLSNLASGGISFFDYIHYASVGILRSSSDLLKAFFTNLKQFVDDSLADAILSTNIPVIRAQIQPMNYKCPKGEHLDLPRDEANKLLGTLAIYGIVIGQK